MIDKEGCAHIMDFGIARLTKSKGKTGIGSLIGTPEYLSPEQAEGKEVDQRADIYSLGIIMYEMLTGHTPFEGDTPLSIAMKHIKEPPKAPKELNPSIPPELNQLVLKCIAKDKESRYRTAKEVLADISSLEKGIPTTEKKIIKKTPITSKEFTVSFSIRKLLLPFFAICALAAVVSLSLLLFPKKDVPPKSIAVIGFENLSGEASYDYLQDALPNLLITSLEQSKYLKLTSWERLNDLIEQEGLDKSSLLDQELVYDLCRREGIEHVVAGTFTKAGSVFATDVRVMDVTSRTILKRTSARGEGIESILNKQIDDLSKEIARAVGLSERNIARESIHITDVTTTSMEAYNYFLRGREEFEKSYNNDALRFMERAVALDEEFALAYAYLYTIHQTLGNVEAANTALENFQKYGKQVKGKDGAYVEVLKTLLVDRDRQKYGLELTELVNQYPKEKRFRYSFGRYLIAENRLEEAEHELHKALELDPMYGIAINQLAYMYMFKNEYEKALEYFKRYASVSPGDANPFDSMGELYFRMGDYDEAIKKYEEALDVKADFGSEWKLAYIHGLKGDYIEAENWIERAIQAATTDGLRSTAFHWKGYYLYLQGKVKASLEAFDKGSEFAEKAGLTGIMDLALRMKLWVCYEWGLYDQFEKFVQQRVDFRNSNKLGSETLNQIILLMYMGLLDIKNGRVDEAKNNLNEIKQLIETLEENEKNIRQKGDGELLRAILLAEGPYDKAIEAFEQREIVPFNFTQFYTLLRPNCPYELDYTAQAYWKNGNLDKAVQEYERALSPDPGLREQLLIHPLAYYRLAKLYEEKGERKKAVEQYQNFLSLCAESDPGLTAVEDARKKLSDLT